MSTCMLVLFFVFFKLGIISSTSSYIQAVLMAVDG